MKSFYFLCFFFLFHVETDTFLDRRELSSTNCAHLPACLRAKTNSTLLISRVPNGTRAVMLVTTADHPDLFISVDKECEAEILRKIQFLLVHRLIATSASSSSSSLSTVAQRKYGSCLSLIFINSLFDRNCDLTISSCLVNRSPSSIPEVSRFNS